MSLRASFAFLNTMSQILFFFQNYGGYVYWTQNWKISATIVLVGVICKNSV